MTEHILLGLASIIIFGIGAQWLAWRLKLPSILFLLILGFIAGPVTGFLNPDKLFGHLLLPVVSISVAVILFEGGLNLNLSELHEIGKVLRNLITVGVFTTCVSTALLAYLVLNLDVQVSILLGAILVVTGPTVILPLLRHVRPKGRVGNIVKWEGIMNDPVGALLAVLVFEAILASTLQQAGILVFLGVVKTIFFGTIIGIAGAWLLVILIQRHWLPDFLQETVTLMLVILAFVSSNMLQEESGLFTVTLMGAAFANQKKVIVKHILEFKENLRILIISSLFILLAARLQVSVLEHINFMMILFLALLMFAVRPAAVFISSIGSDLNWRERLFISWMAPRGIVAAAISSIFAFRLVDQPDTEYLVPVTFLVIIATVAIYGLTASPVARWLGVANVNPQGILILGAHPWARAVAKAIQAEGFKVLLVDSNRSNEFAARMEGLSTYHGSILSEYILDDVDLDGIGRLVALTSNDEANSLAALHFTEIFERTKVYQLPPEKLAGGEEAEFSPQHLRGRLLFGKNFNFSHFDRRFLAGAEIKSTNLTEEFNYDDFLTLYNDRAIPLFLVSEDDELVVFTTDVQPLPLPGQILISMVDPKKPE